MQCTVTYLIWQQGDEVIPWVLPPEQGSLGRRSVVLQLLMGSGGSERAQRLGLHFRNEEWMGLVVRGGKT